MRQCFRGDHIGQHDDLKILRRRSILELDEVHALAVPAGLHPTIRGNRIAGFPHEDVGDISTFQNQWLCPFLPNLTVII
jgi:hypothetical protein